MIYNNSEEGPSWILGTPRRKAPRRPVVVSRDPISSTGVAGSEIMGGSPVECYKFVSGATTYRYTSADRSITLSLLDSGTYTPNEIDRDAIDHSQEPAAQYIAIRLPKADPLVLAYRSYNPVTPIPVTIYRKHRSDPEESVIFVGEVVSVLFDGPEAAMTCAPISLRFQRRIPALAYQSQCVWALYGTGCGIAKASFKSSGTITAILGDTISAAVFGTKADGWFTNGWAELANGDRRFITDHVGTLVTLQSPFPSSTIVSAAVDAYAGCQRSEAICTSKFNNLVNFLGFPRIPTRNPFEGSLV